MDEKKIDSQGRKLRDGERERKNGTYEYRYTDKTGRRHSIYSSRLLSSDKVDPSHKHDIPLRQMEKQIMFDIMDGISCLERTTSVYSLCERYIQTKTGVKPTTEMGYHTVLKILRKEPFGMLTIDSIKPSDAKRFLIKLQQEDGRSYSSIQSIRGVLRPAFQMAVEDDVIRKNPFNWQMMEVLVDDSHTRNAICPADERRFLKFLKEDDHFCQYYEGIFILFKTGMRISELCGLTMSDLDFEQREITVDHQIQMKSDGTLYAETPKTAAGSRIIPMSDEVYECFKKVLSRRIAPMVEPTVGHYSKFVWLDYNVRKSVRPMIGMDWDHIFQRAIEKHNSIYRQELPYITPHICRHTYCSTMAKTGMNPKVLQYLMGHSDISVTLDTYTHLGMEDIKNEAERINSLDSENSSVL